MCTYKGSSEIPSGRHNHSVVVHDSAMYVYGGMTDLQAKADFWKWDFGTVFAHFVHYSAFYVLIFEAFFFLSFSHVESRPLQRRAR